MPAVSAHPGVPASTAETRKTLLFCALNLALSVGYSFGFASSGALLTHRFGPASLFPVYLGLSLGALAVSFLFYLLIDHGRRRRVFYAAFILPGILVLLSWLYLASSPANATSYQAVRILYYVLYRLTELEFWYVASLAFTHLEAKKRFSVIVATGIAGDLVGGLLVGLTADRLHAVNLPALWGLILILSPFLLAGTSFKRRGFRKGLHSALETVAPSRPVEIRSYLTKPVTIGLLLFWIIYAFLNFGADYLFNAFAVERMRSADELTAYFGRFMAAASGAVLVYHLVVGSRLFERFGLFATLSFIALLYGISWGLVLWRPSLATAALAKGVIDYFVETLAVARLHTVLTNFPADLRGRVRIFSEGFGRPLGTLLLFALAAFYAFRPDIQILAGLLFAVSCLFAAFPFLFHRFYVDYLIECLHAPDPARVLNAIQALGSRTKKRAVAPLVALLKETRSFPFQKNILLTLGKIQSRESFDELLSLLPTSNEALKNAALEGLREYRNYETVFAVFRLLRAGGGVSFKTRMNAVRVLTHLLGKSMIPALLQALHDKDLRVQADIIEALGTLKDRKTVPVLLPYLDHPHHRIRANAAIALCRIVPHREGAYERALACIDTLIRSGKKMELHAGLYAAAVLGLKPFEKDVLSLMETSDKDLLHFVACTLAGLENPAFLAPFAKLLTDEDEAMAVKTAKRIGQFPEKSRVIFFEYAMTLPSQDLSRIEERLMQAGYDFSEELAPPVSPKDSALQGTRL